MRYVYSYDCSIVIFVRFVAGIELSILCPRPRLTNESL